MSKGKKNGADSASAGTDDNPGEERETLMQISTINAILGGLYDGVIAAGELKKYGDFGIGTFEELDGEMVYLEGKCYQIKGDGVAYAAPDSIRIPFAAVTFFDIDLEKNIPDGTTWQKLQELLDGALPTENIFYALKIEGVFRYMKTRSVPRQVKPYPKLVEITKNQPEFEFEDVTGTIVGFRCPDYVSGINVTGYHLHFLTDGKDAGGHVIDFTVKKATVFADYTSGFSMKLPGEGSDFYKAELAQAEPGALNEAER